LDTDLEPMGDWIQRLWILASHDLADLDLSCSGLVPSLQMV